MVPRAVLMKSGLVSVNTARQVNAAHSKTIVNAARPMSYLSKTTHSTGNPQMDLQDKGVIDSGCSRHMTGNISYLTDYEEIDKGYVAVGVNLKEEKIIGRGTTVSNAEVYLSHSQKAPHNDESELWHRRLGHINFKTMNKLVKGNLEIQLMTDDPPFSKSSKSSPDDGSKPSSDDEKKVDEDLRKDSESIDQEKDDNVNTLNKLMLLSTNAVNVVGENSQ
ncbi:ribonuclease H-like domain-containing protein [Tanacetum coccineum]